MALTLDYVTRLFENLSNGNTNSFFDTVVDDVHWTVMGTHPLAGVYNSKADFLNHKFERLGKILKEGPVVMKLDHIYVSGDTRYCRDDFYIYCSERKTIPSKVLQDNSIH